MKIHESMNVLLRNKFRYLFWGILLFLGFGHLQAQNSTLQVFDVVVVKNDTFEFDPILHHSVSAYLIKVDKENSSRGNAFFDPHGPNSNFGTKAPNGGFSENHLFYAPVTDFIGRDTVVAYYEDDFGNGLTIKKYNVYNILVVPSYLVAEDDYASTTMGVSVEVDVLANDFGNGTNLTINEITNINRGTATIDSASTKITFTPYSGFSGTGHLNYTICDAEGSCAIATVSITVVDPNPMSYDSIFIATEKNAAQVVLMDVDNDYYIDLFPSNGDTATFETLTYVPDSAFVGYDKIVFKDSINNRTRVFEIRVLDVPNDNFLLFDDIVYTPIDEVVEEIHLLDNDNAGAYLTSVGVGSSTTDEGGQLVYLPSIGKGVYKYFPPAGFSGIDHFNYHAYSPGSGFSENADCYIVVGDLNPELSLYNLVTPEKTPIALADNLPFAGYEYQITSNPTKGSLTFLPGYDTYTSQHGQEFSGVNMLIYDPDPNSNGIDEFEVEYCVGPNTNCQLAKVEIEIITVSTPQSDTLCAGSGCVWSGDADKNGKVDINDLLPIGMCMGTVGENRPSGSIDWYGQYGDDWNSFNANGLGFDVKHIDTDGNGIISAMDTSAIREFYGNYNNIVPEPHDPISSLPFYPGSFPGNPEPGDVIYIPLHLGDANNPAFDAYGLTFGVDYDPALFESVKVFWSDTAWMNYNSPVLSMDHTPYLGKLEAGYTRTSGQAASGYGIIGVLEFIVIDDINGNRPNDPLSTINITGNLMNSGGQTFTLNENTITFSLAMNEEGSNTEGASAIDRLKVYPNPSSAVINVHLNGQENLMERIALFSLVGASVYDSGAILAKRQKLDVANLNSGMYVAKVWTNNGEILTTKIQVVK